MCISLGVSDADLRKVLSKFYVILVSNSFLFLVAMPGTPNSVLAPSSDALCLVAPSTPVESHRIWR